uniref:RING-CH-type domain-containing protein n=1 Tax=Rhabditophanes sp. KR3021 TaxID=114890 RepID=A0AC35U2H0_9BILA
MIKHGENTDDSDNTFDSSLSSCRVCYSGEVSGAFGEGNKYGSSLINSCKCRGSSGLYHRYCLEKWINGIEKESPLICEVCMSPYNVKMYV